MAKSTVALILLFSVAILVLAGGANADFQDGDPHHRTLRIRVRTACQGNNLILECNRGFRLKVLEAFYGHTSSRICPGVFKIAAPHAAHCSASGALDLVRKKCEGKPGCHLRAVSSVFGNPCQENVRKYLRVRYTCRFQDCDRVARLQESLLRLISRYAELAEHSYGFWRREHYKRRRYRLIGKLNYLRRKFRFCFKCQRGCLKIRHLLTRLAKAQARIKELLKILAAGNHGGHRQVRWHASRWYLKRKLSYLNIRERTLKSRLSKCSRVCRY